MTTVGVFPSRIEAEIAKGLSAQSDINSTIVADDQGGMNPALNFARGVSLLVAEDDLAAAKKLIEDALNNPN